MYVCMNITVCVCMYARMYVCMYVYVCLYVCICMYACTHVCKCVCMHVAFTTALEPSHPHIPLLSGRWHHNWGHSISIEALTLTKIDNIQQDPLQNVGDTKQQTHTHPHLYIPILPCTSPAQCTMTPVHTQHAECGCVMQWGTAWATAIYACLKTTALAPCITAVTITRYNYHHCQY